MIKWDYIEKPWLRVCLVKWILERMENDGETHLSSPKKFILKMGKKI